MFCLEHLNQVILIKRVGPHLPFTNFFNNANLSSRSRTVSSTVEPGLAICLPSTLPSHPPSLLAFQMVNNWKEPSSGSLHANLKRRVWEALKEAEHSQNSTQWSWPVSFWAHREIKSHSNWDCFLAPCPHFHFGSLLIWFKRFGSNCDLNLGIMLLRSGLPLLKQMCLKSRWGKMTSDLSSNPVTLWLLWTEGGRQGPQMAFTLLKISRALHDFKSIYSIPLNVGYSLNTRQDSLAPSLYILLRGWWAYLS